MLSRVRAILAALSLLTVGAGSLTIASPASAAAGVPKVGECHQLSTAQALAMSDTKPGVACSKPHDFQTFAVLTSPTSLAGLTDEQLSAASTACTRPFIKALGPAVRSSLTSYELYTFVPTAAQREAGARWIRCDLTLDRNHRPTALPRHRLSRPIVPSRIPDGVRTCLTRSRAITTCERPHAYRAAMAFVIRQAAYPSEEQFNRAADRRCAPGWALAQLATRRAWEAGRHTVVCFDRTKN
jgi:hypothetical protein